MCGRRFLARAALVLGALLARWPAEGASAEPIRASPLHIIVQPGAQAAPVISLIRSARHTIWLEVYLLTERRIIAALGSVRQQGVDVRVLLEEHPYGSGQSSKTAFSALQAEGVRVRWANEEAFTYTHEKAMVVDGRAAGIFTFNLTASGLLTNREFGIIDANLTDVAALAAIFDADWNRRKPVVNDPNLVVSPYNARTDLQAMIDGAKHTLDIYAEEVTDGTVESHLRRAVQRHVRVRLLTSQSSAGVELIGRAGVMVKILAKPYVHAKAIVADGVRLFVGSENLSRTSLDKNREVGLLSSDRRTIGVVSRTFAADWSGAVSTIPLPLPSTALSVEVTTTPTAVRRGQELTIAAATKPGATCSVQVTYPDGYVSRARALSERETADPDGRVSWSWRVGSSATGRSRVRVSCVLGTVSGSGRATFVIR
jgi:cardiolipin synthase